VYLLKNNKAYLLVVAALISACSSGTLPSSSDEKYVEDLSVHRPEIPETPGNSSSTVEVNEPENNYTAFIEPEYDVTEELDAVLDSIDRIREEIKYVNGFTILVYSGTSSERAHIAKGKVFSALPDSKPILKYDEPNFRVKVGKYYSRLDAQQDYSAIREKFSSAIVIPERIPIN